MIEDIRKYIQILGGLNKLHVPHMLLFSISKDKSFSLLMEAIYGFCVREMSHVPGCS